MGKVLDPGFVPTQDERRRMYEAIEEAGKFFRRQLLLATGGWPSEFLQDRGLKNTLVPGASWKIGYAPDSWSRLTDHLQKRGFELATLVRAGLTTDQRLIDIAIGSCSSHGTTGWSQWASSG
jgi:DNA primase